jgi:putative Ca2+/H+ antiporter (TMEM165/GDT1 family)
METISLSALIVAIAEIGDKTQLLAIILATKFRRPLPIVAGIFAATLLNHAAASALGYWVMQWLAGQTAQIAMGLAFVAMAGWVLIPDKQDDSDATRSRGGVFLTTLVAFFFVEIGDKTQIATSLLAGQFHNIVLVTIGTTLGMMIANVPAVYFGEAITRIVPLPKVRLIAATLFALLGFWIVGSAILRG